MIAPLPTPEISPAGSLSARRAAQAAAGNQHALINLTRLVKSLEGKVNSSSGDDDEWDPYALRRDWETVTYARTLLEILKDGNEQSSKTTATLSELARSLDSVEQTYRIRLSSPAPTPSIHNPALIALPMSPVPSNPITDTEVPLPSSSRPSSNTSSSETNATHPVVPVVDRGSEVRKRRIQTDEYLSRRARESTTGEEASLLPLKDVAPIKKSSKGKAGRDELLGDMDEQAGLGSAQLHEELGGQMADMSHRLKMNAVHFANSLEDEKSLLDDSQTVLEKNLVSTRSSKKHLSSVSSKGKGTTCLTLGVVIFVLVVFVWTYLLIRFT